MRVKLSRTELAYLRMVDQQANAMRAQALGNIMQDRAITTTKVELDGPFLVVDDTPPPAAPPHPTPEPALQQFQETAAS